MVKTTVYLPEPLKARVDPATDDVVATIEVGPNAGPVAVGDGGVWVVVSPNG